MRVGITADNAVFATKEQLTRVLREFGHEVRISARPTGATFGRGFLPAEDSLP